MRIIKLLTLLAFIAISGCATTYYNPNIADVTALERQRAIDEGYCTKASAGSVPMPQVRAYQPQQQNYQISGTMNTYTPNSGYSTSNYSANVYSQPNPGAAFASGLANGMNMGAAIAARQAEEKIFHGCMLSLGWTTDKDAKPSAPTSATVSTGTTPQQAASRGERDEAFNREVEAFYANEAARPGGIDYRNDLEKRRRLIGHAAQIMVGTPGGREKTVTQLLMEANNLVIQGK